MTTPGKVYCVIVRNDIMVSPIPGFMNTYHPFRDRGERMEDKHNVGRKEQKWKRSCSVCFAVFAWESFNLLKVMRAVIKRGRRSANKRDGELFKYEMGGARGG